MFNLEIFSVRHEKMASRKNKIFQIGFNKCGTHSLHHFFLANNIRSVHWGRGQLAIDIHKNARLGLPLLGRFEPHFDAFTDMEEYRLQIFGSFYFQQFHVEHPQAFYILNTRPVDKWISSRFSHWYGKYAKDCMTLLRMNQQQLEDFWRAEWHRHHDRVIDYFKDNPRFMVFDIETDDGTALQEFLKPEYAVDPLKWGHHFSTESSFPT